MNKGLKITLLVLLIILIIGITGVFIAMLTGKLDFNFGSSKLVYDKNITETFNKIEVYTDSLDVKFVKSTDGNVNVKVYDREEDQVSVSVNNNTLTIEKNSNNTCWIFCFGRKEAVVSLPEKEYNLLVESKSGDITSDIDFNNASISTKSGDIELKNVNNATIDVTSGDIDIREVNDLKVNSTSGDLKISKVNNSIDIETTSGDIFIDDLTISKDSKIKVTSGDIVITNSSEDIYYNTSVVSGDVKINNNNRHAKNELKIDTISGDIIVR